MRGIWGFCLVLVFLFWSGEAQAGQLAERLAQFPHWDSKPPVQAVRASEDLIYPNWMAGNWKVTSTLVDLAAPLAPDIVTPGFESNRQYLNQPITFSVRFQPARQKPSVRGSQFLQLKTQNSVRAGFVVNSSAVTTGLSAKPAPTKLKTISVIADRAFNGLNIAKAILGDRAVLSVKVDPNNPNRQITMLQGERQLISVVTGRGSEMPVPDEFIATEVTQQVFRGTPQLYLNEVETTTAYRQLEAGNPSIKADQITAVYLSPQDPNYFDARDKPVALYRYHLEFFQS